MESKPMKADDLGRYVCVAHGGCLHSPDITITDSGVWVKAGKLYSSAHADCFEAWQAREIPTPYVRKFASMHVTALTPEQHERTCNYWYTVTCGATAHTAFTTRRGLMRWMTERGLTIEDELPDLRGDFATMPVIGEYFAASHGQFSPTEDNPYRMIEDDDWHAIKPVVITATLSNGDYTLALISQGAGGVRTVHTLNPNVKTRITADHFAMREQLG